MLSTDSPKTARPSRSMTSRKPRRLSRRRSGVTGLVSVTGARVSAARRTRSRIGGEPADELGDLAAHGARHLVPGVRVPVDDGPRDEVGDLAHLVLAHPL